MNHQEGFFEGVRGSRIYYQSWTPEGDAKAVLLIAHGLAEHSGRYMNVVNHFVPLGYAVYGIDYLGHGKSDGPRTFVQTFDDYLNTLETYHSMVEDWQPSKPIFLVGHSMGGLVAPLFVLAHGPNLAGMIISGPASKVPDYVSQLVIFMGKLLSAILPKVGVQSVDAGFKLMRMIRWFIEEKQPRVWRLSFSRRWSGFGWRRPRSSCRY
jgi:alpha-beta hydrolase superfamily lysophospholipase